MLRAANYHESIALVGLWSLMASAALSTTKKPVVRASDTNPEQLEPDYDGISYIANQWVFIEH